MLDDRRAPALALARIREAMSFPAPFDRYRGEVRSEWIDHNGHMNLAYYTVLFDYATDLMFDALDLGLAYRRRTDLGTFVTETHNRYERELLIGDKVRVSIQILHADDKRLHLAHEMFHLDSGERAATQELLFIHVDLNQRRVTPFPPDLKARVEKAAAAHAALPRPAWVGRHVGMPR
jgi:acyl-CoA thioester hydrolase